MLNRLPLPEFARRLQKRIRARPDTEFQQALIRFIIGVIAYLYFSSSWIAHTDSISSSIHFIALFFISTASLILASTLISLHASPRRRLFGAIVDFSSATFMMLIGGETSAPLVGLYLWVTLGNGFRYGVPYVNPFLKRAGSAPVAQTVEAGRLLRRPEFLMEEFLSSGLADEAPVISKIRALGSERLRREIFQQVDIELKYEGYFRRQEDEVRKFETYEAMRIPERFDFAALRSLSSEGREKMSRVRPASIGQASRISGVTASDISVLMIHLRK